MMSDIVIGIFMLSLILAIVYFIFKTKGKGGNYSVSD